MLLMGGARAKLELRLIMLLMGGGHSVVYGRELIVKVMVRDRDSEEGKASARRRTWGRAR